MSGSRKSLGILQTANVERISLSAGTHQDEVPAEYWQILAERRREALEDALDENKKIHGENEKLLEELMELRLKVDQLQDDNAQLLELAGEAEYFASMLKKFTDEADSKDNGENCHSKDMAVKEGNSDADGRSK